MFRGLRQRSRFNTDQTGAALVEFSVTVPMLLVLMCGGLEFGRILFHHEAINNSVRNAARFLSHVPATCAGPSGSDETRAKNLARTGSLDASDPAIISYWTSDGTISVTTRCVDNSTETFYGREQIPVITVSASVGYDDLGMLSFLGIDPVTLAAEHEVMNLGE